MELKATVNQNPVKPTITGPTEVCEGSTATLTVGAVAGVTYNGIMQQVDRSVRGLLIQLRHLLPLLLIL